MDTVSCLESVGNSEIIERLPALLGGLRWCDSRFFTDARIELLASHPAAGICRVSVRGRLDLLKNPSLQVSRRTFTL